jgi:hypothetical protein
MVHFKRENVCADKLCKEKISLDWLKSFGIREFAPEMYDFEHELGCEESRLLQIADRKSHAMIHCPNFDKEAASVPAAQVHSTQADEKNAAQIANMQCEFPPT